MVSLIFLRCLCRKHSQPASREGDSPAICSSGQGVLDLNLKEWGLRILVESVDLIFRLMKESVRTPPITVNITGQNLPTAYYA